MRLITVHGPKGSGKKMAEFAFSAGVSEVSLQEASVLHSKGETTVQDVMEFKTTTNNGKHFIERLMTSPLYDPDTFSFTTREPQSIFANEPPEIETDPIIRPTTDVYVELWQFTLITKSLIGRVFLSSFLLAYGMHSGYMPLIIAGLLFLPFHHHLLGMALGAGIKEWKFFRQGVYTFLLSTLLIMSGGVAVAFLTDSGVKFTEFTHTPLHWSFLISAGIGIAAGLAATDDAGRKELIGLAATAHVSIYPVYFGLKMIYGFDPGDKPLELILVFLMDVATIVIFSLIVFKIMKMKGGGIERFVKNKERKKI